MQQKWTPCSSVSCLGLHTFEKNHIWLQDSGHHYKWISLYKQIRRPKKTFRGLHNKHRVIVKTEELKEVVSFYQ